jgi:hypothetical protein
VFRGSCARAVEGDGPDGPGRRLRRADRRFGHVDLDRVKVADEIELEQTIDRLVDRYHAAREGSAEHKMIIHQLQACATAVSWAV